MAHLTDFGSAQPFHIHHARLRSAAIDGETPVQAYPDKIVIGIDDEYFPEWKGWLIIEQRDRVITFRFSRGDKEPE